MKTQKFKGQKLTTKKAVKNILEIYNQATDATNWYIDANKYAKDLSILTGYPVIKICGVIAALSPLKSWDENKIIAKSFLTGGKAKHTKVMVNKAKDILAGSGEIEEICNILNGNKITSFFINLYLPAKKDNVTIDRHALAVILGRNIKDNEAQITKKQYEFFEDCYKIAAAKVNVNPNYMQSAVWEKWRELKNEAKFEDVPF